MIWQQTMPNPLILVPDCRAAIKTSYASPQLTIKHLNLKTLRNLLKIYI